MAKHMQTLTHIRFSAGLFAASVLAIIPVCFIDFDSNGHWGIPVAIFAMAATMWRPI
jgi:hypothetical protein